MESTQEFGIATQRLGEIYREQWYRNRGIEMVFEWQILSEDVQNEWIMSAMAESVIEEVA